jgi:hypothetical protein
MTDAFEVSETSLYLSNTNKDVLGVMSILPCVSTDIIL